MATKSSKDIQNNIKRLRIILNKQRESLKSLDLNDPEFNQLKKAIAKTESEISKNDVEYNKVFKVETAAKTQEDLGQAQEDLKYAEAGGDPQEIAAAKESISKAQTSKEAANIAVTDKQAPATSAAALGLPASSLTRPSTAVEKTAKAAADAKGQVPPKTKDKPKDKTTPALTDAQQREEALGVVEGTDFALPETIFNNVPSLKRILDRYVAEDWTPDKLRKAIRDDVWYRQNSGAIKQRYVQLFNYRDLVKTGQAQGTTQYEQDIVKLERQIADKARTVGSGIASDPTALRKAAENMYITNVGIDDAMTTDFIAAAIRPIGSTIGGKPTEGYSGKALQDYQLIQAAAKANGFKVSDIIPGGSNEQQVLQGIATGSIDINRIAQDARKLAAQGQPQYVRDLLGQGYNLDQVYAPYRTTMANLLELNADQIDLNDPTLRMAITDKGDMNVYDFKKALKADSRWQYTENARSEVSTAAFNVLRDFGFQG
jgi:hypothetical protein